MHRRLQKVFKKFKVGGSGLSAQKVTEGFQEFQSRGKSLNCKNSRLEELT